MATGGRGAEIFEIGDDQRWVGHEFRRNVFETQSFAVRLVPVSEHSRLARTF